MAIRKESQLKTSRRIASIWVVISLGVAVFMGIVGSAALPELVDRASLIGASEQAIQEATSTSETIFIAIADKLGNNGILPALIAGVILAGILAATMSTADSQLLAASSGISQNFFKGIIHMKASDKTTMWVARGTVIVIAIVGAVIASNPNSSIFEIVSFAWAGFGATFGPVVLFSLFWKRTTLSGALCGMLAGGVMVFVWKFLLKPLGGIWGIYELLPAFLVACAAILVVSLLTKAPGEDIIKEFDLAASKTPLEEVEQKA